MDWLTSEQRSRNMSAIRSRGNNSTEQAIRFRMIRTGLKGWTLCRRDLPGKPDFVFEEVRLAVFVDGCYWHGCPKCYRPPSSNTDYWSEKYKKNKARDRRVVRLLNRDGWRVIRFWEHEIEQSPGKVVEKIRTLVSQLSERPSESGGTS
ncbi:MAG: very short patch repair endonuclease [Bryobacterales bacterium]|nr:very short patch repair endonuclease [Bryobacterales bacterium]